jgi:hypothetical protein
VYQGEGHLAFGEITAEGFSETIDAGHVVEGIIGDLKGHPDKIAELLKGIFFSFGNPRENSSETTRACREGRRLAGGHIVVVFLGGRKVTVKEELEDFSLRHFFAGEGQGVVDLVVVKSHGEPEGIGIEEIADEDGGLIAPPLMGGGLSAPKIGAVHDIVVEKGGGMDHLYDGREQNGGVTLGMAET